MTTTMAHAILHDTYLLLFDGIIGSGPSLSAVSFPVVEIPVCDRFLCSLLLSGQGVGSSRPKAEQPPTYESERGKEGQTTNT
jgi:hypothetical protein